MEQSYEGKSINLALSARGRYCIIRNQLVLLQLPNKTDFQDAHFGPSALKTLLSSSVRPWMVVSCTTPMVLYPICRTGNRVK